MEQMQEVRARLEKLHAESREKTLAYERALEAFDTFAGTISAVMADTPATARATKTTKTTKGNKWAMNRLPKRLSWDKVPEGPRFRFAARVHREILPVLKRDGIVRLFDMCKTMNIHKVRGTEMARILSRYPGVTLKKMTLADMGRTATKRGRAAWCAMLGWQHGRTGIAGSSSSTHPDTKKQILAGPSTGKTSLSRLPPSFSGKAS